ncbi:MAG TPA: PKD domain-containing protein [Pyrinomonadaceae bacterium]|nr:PKD domain-containing protein [Pyrinomonadaceae bacterium]
MQITVDRRRVPLGEIVTFTLSPANVVRSSLYNVMLNFGDGKQQPVRATEVTHLYRAVGTYFYSVKVNAIHPIPNVTLSATPAPVNQGEQVNFTAQISSDYPNIQYRFTYGDGSSSGWQNSSRSIHAYQSPGRYLAYVDIGDDKTKPLGGSTRKGIEVNQTSPFTVALSVNPSPAKARKPVNFTAKWSPGSSSGAEYRFYFGDSQSTGWQTSPLASHIYRNAGNYRAHVEARPVSGGRSGIATSAPTAIDVEEPGGVTPDPTPAPTPRPSPAPSPASSPSSSPTPLTSPSPDPTGTNGNGGGSSSSPSPGASTSPDPNASPASGSSLIDGFGPFGLSDNWWKYLLIALLILFVIYQMAGLFVPQPKFAAFSDPGVSALANNERRLPLDFQLLLNRNVTTGSYSVETGGSSLVKNADSKSDRQILEI